MTKPTRTISSSPSFPASLASCLITAFVAFAPAPAQAQNQAQDLDPSRLIEVLADEGMSELLEHLVETHPPDDPVLRAQIEIARHRLRYGDPALDREVRLHAFDQALDRLRQLIADHPDHVQRPMWQTDLAALLLNEYLGVIHQNAAEFHQFGLTTPEQAAAYRAASIEALEMAASAKARLFEFQTLLPRDPDHIEKHVNTGLWSRMMEEYDQKRTPFYLAQAAHQVSMLPLDDPYYTQPDDRVPGRRSEPAQERRRLTQQVRQMLQPFVDDDTDAARVRLPSLTLLGRSLLSQGEPAAAVEAFEPVVRAANEDVFDLLAKLGLARAAAMQGQPVTALDRLSSLADHAAVRSNLLYRLLLTDGRHQVLLAQARDAPTDQRAAALARAYAPYQALLNDPALHEHAAALRRHIARRWAAGVGADAEPGSLPPMVRLAVADVELERAEAIVSGRSSEDADAAPHLRRSIRFSESLLDEEPGVAPPMRARAMFNLAQARYLTDPQDLATLLDASALFVRLAREMPDQPEAERAIGRATALLRAVHALEPRPPGVDAAYRQAAEVLFERFPTSRVADDERLYYSYYVLMEEGNTVGAIEMLSRVPPGHPDHLAAQREILFAMEQTMLEAEGEQQAELRRALRDRAATVRAAAQQRGDDAGRRALAAVRLVLASADAEEGERDAALDQLADMEKDFADLPDMARLAMQRRIDLLARTGRWGRIPPAAQAMMRAHPDAAAGVIDQVLTQIEARIDTLQAEAAAEAGDIRRGELTQQTADLAAVAAPLSTMLVGWARAEGYGPAQMLPFELIQARALRLIGEHQQAAEITASLLAAFPSQAEVIASHAESLFALGDEPSLRAAAELYDALIAGLPRPYPPLWWNAWMRRLQINDRLGEGVAEIPLRVRQLQRTDPNLGGQPYRGTLERLAEKHQ